MPIEQTFEKREDAPEFLRNSLLEDGGRFVFRAELPTETAGIKTALQKEREAKATLEKTLKGYEGIDPERARQLEQEAERQQREGLKSKGDWETREKQLQERLAADLKAREAKYQAEIDATAKRAEKLQRSLEQYLVQAEASAAIAAQGGVPELILPHVMSQVKVMEEGESFVARVIGKDGNPRIADVKGTPLTIHHLVEEMRQNPVYGRAFDASKVGGSGAPGQSTGGPGGSIRLTREQAKDPHTYRRAKEQADKAGVKLEIWE